MAVGMGLVVQVGEADDMVKPPVGFPKCGNYKPQIFEAPPAVAEISPSGGDEETPAASDGEESPPASDREQSPPVADVSISPMDISLGLESVAPFTFNNEVYQPYYENIST